MKADLVMAIHFHQPVGNFDHVIENICNRCYKPFMEELSKYPEIRMSFHLTGCLLEWLEEHREDIIEMIQVMVTRGQIEMIAGGFYEPILPSIPERDRIAQIGMLKQYANDKFGYAARGAWIAERVWEPSLPTTLSDAGIRYVILDDTHFLYSGIKKDKTYGYYVTEDNGKTLAVFPSDKILRYHMPFKMPEDCIGYMKYIAETHDDPTLVYGDDGEKFGEWPGTYKWVYEDGWLKGFFDKLMENRGWLNTITFSECLEKKRSLGMVYLPTSSYEEMLEWALPAGSQEEYEDVLDEIRSAGNEERYKPYFRGGFWRNFLSKYPESNGMNKKMIHVSSKINDLENKGNGKEVLEKAKNELFKGQCNCAYWHGVFGGLYLFHLRSAIYEHLIKSEALVDAISRKNKGRCHIDILDYDADGREEAVISSELLWALFDPADGGVVKEIDIRELNCNIMNGFTRRKEAYHRIILKKIQDQISKEPEECQTIHDAIQVVDENIKEHLVYDKYPKCGLIDHFISDEVNLDDFSDCRYSEKGDFIQAEYDIKTKVSGVKAEITLSRKGLVQEKPFGVVKKVSLSGKKARMYIEYELKNLSGEDVDILFGPEFNFSLPDFGSCDYGVVFKGSRKRNSIKDKFEKNGAKVMKVSGKDGALSLQMIFSDPCRLWHFPVETVSQSETSYEKNYQGSSFIPFWRIKLGKNKEKKLSIDLKMVSR